MPIKDYEKLRAARQRCNDKRRGKRTRGWACIAWQDSAPDGWIERLAERHVKILVSPLHDKDVAYDEATDEQRLKKLHWHVLAMFEHPASEAQAQELFCSAGICFKADGTPAPPEMVRSIKGYARYLVHMDDHEKYRYEDREVIELGGASWRLVALDRNEMDNIILREIRNYIFLSGCDSFAILSQYADDCRLDWVEVIQRRQAYLRTFLQSYTFDVKRGTIDPPTDSVAWRGVRNLKLEADKGGV